MIEGLNIRCNVGGFEILRAPRLELAYRRRAVLTRGEIEIPDPEGGIRGALAIGQPVRFRFGYRGEAGPNMELWHDWQGSIDGFRPAGPDAFTVLAVGREKALQTTAITESYHGEPAATVARRLLAATGLAVDKVDIPGDILPHMVFSGVSVARAIRQLAQSLELSLGYDLSRHAVWLGQNGLCWSDGDEPGTVYSIASCENLIEHAPAAEPGGLNMITAVLLPGLTDGRLVRLADARRGLQARVKALEVRHRLSSQGNTTTILYGAEHGWG
jgi:hypothetical protein